MRQFAAEIAQPSTSEKSKERKLPLQESMEWFLDGGMIYMGGARLDYETCVLYVNRRLHVLRTMTDDEYVAMLRLRCFRDCELEPIEIGGVLYSARAYKIREARENIRHLTARLEVVVRSLPARAGYAADQDYFGLRGARKRWYVNCKFASYIPLNERLKLFKEMRQIERGHEERRRKDDEDAIRAAAYPELIRRIRELEEDSKKVSKNRAGV